MTSLKTLPCCRYGAGHNLVGRENCFQQSYRSVDQRDMRVCVPRITTKSVLRSMQRNGPFILLITVFYNTHGGVFTLA